MSEKLPIIYLVRHGQTAWSLSGQHTGLTDLPLTEHGEQEARRLHDRLANLQVARRFRSPSLRARETCALAGLGDVTEDDPDLVEWNYGDYEGLTSGEIHEKRPDWSIYRDGCPNGESPEQITARAERVIARLRAIPGNVMLFSSGHFLRVLTTRWLDLEICYGRFLALSTASVGSLGYENKLAQPVIRSWNDTSHLEEPPKI
jgi:probable phosphoglycerate mutase